jgi:hypothetical protein
VRVRPVISAGPNALTFEYAEDQYGIWSSAISFADNVAPCDSDFVGIANLTSANGGVQITAIAGGIITAGLTAADSTKWIKLTFPEDMDTSTKPTITFARGTAAAALYAAVGGALPGDPSIARGDGLLAANYTGWHSTTEYYAYIKFPTLANYTAASAATPYIGYAYNVSVAGMKDNSGVTIQDWGSMGTVNPSTTDLANGTAGSRSLGGWRR